MTYEEKIKIKKDEDLEMELGQKDEDVYSEEGREHLVEDDEISPTEAGFMKGEEDGGKDAVCTSCGQILQEDHEEIVEKEFDGEIRLFCNSECVEDYEKKQSKA